MVRAAMRRRVAAGAALTLALSGAIVTTTAVVVSPSADAAQADVCPDPGSGPPISGGGPQFSDSNVAVFAGGNFTVAGTAAESEGLLVVGGNATIDKTPAGLFNVGTVGAGSQIGAPSGSTMMVVGGDLTLQPGNRIDVGSGTTGGGNVAVAGGITSDAGAIQTNDGAVLNPSDLYQTDYADFGSTIASESATLAGETANGTTSISGNQLTLTGDGASHLQVFTLTASTFSAVRELLFTDIAVDANGAYAPIVINVVGDAAISWSAPNYVAINGTAVNNFNDKSFGNASSAIMWNFAQTTSLTLGGTDQFMGSILVPRADSDVTITASTNGRVYVGGDLRTAGSGNELHNFPWTGSDTFDCIPPGAADTGSAEITKALTPGTFLDDLVNANGQRVRFHGTVSCVLPDDGGTYTEAFTVRAGTTFTMDGLPLEATCTVSEDPTATDQGVNPDYELVDVGAYVWQRPRFTVDGDTTNAFTVTSASTAVTIGIQNSLLGTLSVTKEVNGPDGGLSDADRTYDVDWACTTASGSAAGGYVVAGDGLGDPDTSSTSSGTMTVADGSTAFPETPDDDRLYFAPGTTCTISEVMPTGGLNDGYHWEPPTLDPASGEVTIGGDSVDDGVQAVTVTNTFAPTVGGFTVAKAVTGDTGASRTTFDIDWQCSAANTAGDDDGTVHLADGGSETITGFPVGTTCTVTEDTPTDDNGTWGTPTINPDDPITIAEGDGTAQVVTVTNTFDRATGSFQITKALSDDSDPGSSVTEFSGTYTCTPPDGEDGTPITGGWGPIAAGDTTDPITGIPTGWSCQITETAPDDDNGSWSTPTIGPNPVMIDTDTDSVQTVTVTNTFTRAVGGFTIRKTVTGDDGASTATFTGTWTCDAPNTDGLLSGTWTLSDDETLALDGFPTGTLCMVTETPPTDANGSWTSSIEPSGTFPITEGDATNLTVTVTNTFTHAIGGFTILKTVTGDAGPTTTTFSGTWTCDAPDAQGDSSGPWTLQAGGVVAFDGFPTGTTCSVTEDPPTDDNGTWTSSINPSGDFTITEGTSATQVVTVTNTFAHAVGGFTIVKSVAGDPGAATTTFTGTWTCDAPNADGESTGTWTLSDGDTLAVDGFPTGTTCSVTETAPTDQNGTWASSIDPAGDFVITEGTSATQVVTVTNTFDRATGSFQITKALSDDSDPGSSVTEFSGTYTCTPPDGEDGTPITGGWGPIAAGDTTDPITGIPTGWSCQITETAPDDDNGSWSTPTIGPNPVMIDTDTDSVQTVTVTNTFTHAIGGFTILKTVTGDTGATTTTFSGTWTCDAPDAQGDDSGTWSLEAGGSVAFDGFPTGTTCSVTEDPPTDDNGTWTSSINPSGDFTITEGTSATRVVTVTNTFAAARGGFTIQKEVTGDPGASTTSFDIAWQCSAENSDGDDSGTVHLADGETATITGFPVGTTCTVTEDTPTDDNGTWGTPTINPDGPITIAKGDGTAQVVTVTNTFVAPTPTPTPTTPAPTSPAPSTTTPAPAPTSGPTTPVADGGGLAVTGFEALTIAAVGAFLLALGLAAVLIARRRRS